MKTLIKLKIRNYGYRLLFYWSTWEYLLAPFIGKELYKYYTKYIIQQKLDRILKLNDKLKRLNDFNS
jgi:hypothetical protein